MTKLLTFFLLLSLPSAGNKEERVLVELTRHQKLICSAAHFFSISPRTVVSVIYAERFLNYNWEDDLLDKLFAESGYNSSIGFGQIKPNTAFFIEQELYEVQSKYFLGSNIQAIIKRSKSKKEIIEKLVNDTTNIYYCSAYLAMIRQRWSKTFLFQSQNEAGILATLYSLGVVKFDGTERVPHDNPQMNLFGKTAQAFFNSFVLREIFPN